MHEEVGFLESLFGWLNEHAGWFVPLAGAVVALMYRVHKYFTGLNRVSEEVSKLTDSEDGVMMKKDVMSTIAPVTEHIATTDGRLDRIESQIDMLCSTLINNREHNERADDK